MNEETSTLPDIPHIRCNNNYVLLLSLKNLLAVALVLEIVITGSVENFQVITRLLPGLCYLLP